jgi:hypothetical protein
VLCADVIAGRSVHRYTAPLMTSRFVSLLLAVWLLMSGLSTPAQGAVTAERGPAVEALLADGFGADDSPTAPVTPETLGEREGLIDLPELFNLLHGPEDGGVAAAALPCPALASPATPFLEGLRRPPRGQTRLG